MRKAIVRSEFLLSLVNDLGGNLPVENIPEREHVIRNGKLIA